MNIAVNLNAVTPQRIASYKNQLSASLTNVSLFTEPAHLPTNPPNVTPYQLTAYVFQTVQGDGTTRPTIGPLTVTYDDGLGPKTVMLGVMPTSPLNGDDTKAAAITANTPGNLNSAFSGQVCFALAGGKSVTFSCPFKSSGAVQGQYAILLMLQTL
jgi:hypothetical protein